MPRKAVATTVDVDTTRVVNMLKTLTKRSEKVDLRNEGKKAVASVRLQQQRRTGKLADGTKLRVIEPDHVQVVNDVFYARFNWRGTKFQPAKPPIVTYRASEMKKDVVGQIFWTPSDGFATTPSD